MRALAVLALAALAPAAMCLTTIFNATTVTVAIEWSNASSTTDYDLHALASCGCHVGAWARECRAKGAALPFAALSADAKGARGAENLTLAGARAPCGNYSVWVRAFSGAWSAAGSLACSVNGRALGAARAAGADGARWWHVCDVAATGAAAGDMRVSVVDEVNGYDVLPVPDGCAGAPTCSAVAELAPSWALALLVAALALTLLRQ
eukprot:m51a1_g3012 hypothetical protein (207) ;mRNA; r:852992-853733